MALSSSWLFNTHSIPDSPFLLLSSMVRFDIIVEGVPNGLDRKFGPTWEGDKAWFFSVGEEGGLKCKVGLTISSLGLMYCLLSWSLGFVAVVVGGGVEVCLFGPVILLPAAGTSCWATLLGSDGPVSLCTTSLKEFVSVCTNVVKGLQPAVTWVNAGFSMMFNLLKSFGEDSFQSVEALDLK